MSRYVEIGFRVDTDLEIDGRWIAEVESLPGTMAYGATEEEAIKNVKVLALQVIAEQVKNGQWE